jgi:signal transduction histidine kinase
LGNQQIHALSEIEIWSHGNNLAYGRPVMREHNGQSSTITSLTNGYSSTKKIIPLAIWFHQLHEREHIERELMPLRSVQRESASNSELNATWSLSMILGLALMIPVFIVERRRLMTKDQLDQIRKRISADLHDDIGSNLGSISLIAHSASKDLIRLHGPMEIASDLAEMETIARESSLAMRDIVWLLERQRDSIGDLLQRMREITARLLREIHYTLECESNKTTTKLSLDAKRHLFLFYKEAIHNILKHSRATHVSVRLWDENDQLAIEIIDNGIGIPVTAEGLPTTVKKLEDRARLLNGQLQITSSKETGSRIQLLIKCSNLTTPTTPS